MLTLSGVFPLGFFLVEHIGLNASSLGGAARFDAVVGALIRSWWMPIVEIVIVLVPLLIHTVYGLHVLMTRKRIREYPLMPDRMQLLQRVTSVVLLLFLAGHLWELRIHRWMSALPVSAIHARLAEHMSSTKWSVPWIAVGYLLGLAAASFHLANGLWAYGVERKRLESELDKKRAATVPFLVGAVLFVIGATTIVTLATGGGFLSEPEPPKSPCGVPTASAAAP
jgi:succinate dehydrogenase / fumarate reductase cytochrome b subunit